MVEPISVALKSVKLVQMIQALPSVYRFLSSGVELLLDEQKFTLIFEQYFDRVYTKYYYANTLLLPNSKVKLEDIYHPAVIFPVSRKNGNEIFEISDYPFDFLIKNSRVLVKDSAGMGKSTMLRHIFLKAIDFIDEGKTENCKIPILIDLRKMEKHKTLEDLIFNELMDGEKKEFVKPLFQLFESGKFIFLFDGFDEISRNNYESALFEIKQFTEKYFKNNFILTSRDEPILNSLSTFVAFKIKGLDEPNAVSLIKKYCNCLKVDLLAEKLLAELKVEGNRTLFRLLENPLIVCLLVVAYNSKNKIPLKKVDFYDQVFDALFEKHDLTKNTSFDRAKQSGLGRSEFCSVLRCIAIIGLLHYEGKVEYSRTDIEDIVDKAKNLSGKEFNTDAFINDLASAVPLFAVDGHYYRWMHKSFMDYYAASWLYYDKHVDMDKIKESIFNNIKSNLNLIALYYELNEIDVSKVLFKPIFSDYINHVASKANEYRGLLYKFHGVNYFATLKIKPIPAAPGKTKDIGILSTSRPGKSTNSGITKRTTEWHQSNLVVETEVDSRKKDVLDLARACKLPVFAKNNSWNVLVNPDRDLMFSNEFFPANIFSELNYELFGNASAVEAEYLITISLEALDLRNLEISESQVIDWLKGVEVRIACQNKIKLV